MPARLLPLLAAAAALGGAPRPTAAAPPPAPPPAPAPITKFWVYLGTYTGGKSGSRGIYRCEADTTTGKLSAPELAAEMANPTFLSVAHGGRMLYAVGEVADAGPAKTEGVVAAFAVDQATGRLTKVGERTTGGAGPCHVGTDGFGRYLAVSNYGGGSWKLFHLDPRGLFAEGEHFVQFPAAGPKKPHAHCGVFSPTIADRVYVSDLGTDRVYMTDYKAAPGAAGPVATDLPPLELPKGSGPRHIAVGAFERLYVCGEHDSTLNVVNTDPKLPEPRFVQTVSTLPGGKPVKGNSTAEVKLLTVVSGQTINDFAYVSNRGHNSIAVFAVDQVTGRLTPAGHATSPDVKTPRNFNILPGGRWMLVASQDADNVAVFAVDPATGMPKSTGDKIAVGKPVCVTFLAKR